MTARKHHFVSQFYLRNFSTGDGHKSELCAFERETGESFSIKVKDAAAKRDFNRLDIENVDQNELEKKLAEIEAICATQFSRIIENQSLDFHSHDALVTFIALMFLNGQQVRNGIEDMLDGMGKLQTDMFFNQDNLHEKLGVTIEEAEQAKKAYQDGAFRLKANQNYTLKLQFSHLDMIRSGIEKRKWAIFHTPENNQFITSDNPVCLQWLESGYKRFGDIAPIPSLFAPESSLIFPISSNLIIFGCLEKDFPEGGSMIASAEEVASLNGAIAKNSLRHFYSKDKDFTISLKSGNMIPASDMEKHFSNKDSSN